MTIRALHILSTSTIDIGDLIRNLSKYFTYFSSDNVFSCTPLPIYNFGCRKVSVRARKYRLERYARFNSSI